MRHRIFASEIRKLKVQIDSTSWQSKQMRNRNSAPGCTRNYVIPCIIITCWMFSNSNCVNFCSLEKGLVARIMSTLSSRVQKRTKVSNTTLNFIKSTLNFDPPFLVPDWRKNNEKYRHVICGNQFWANCSICSKIVSNFAQSIHQNKPFRYSSPIKNK